MFFSRIKVKGTAFLKSTTGRKVVKTIRIAFQGCLVVYLLFQFAELGWVEILKSLPANPLFYVFFLILFFALPVTETIVYKVSWHFRFSQALPVFLKKRVLNKDVLGYSGEVYLALWARNQLKLNDRKIWSVLKDNTILSSAASTLYAVAVLAILLLTGNVELGGITAKTGVNTVIAAFLIAVVSGIIAYRFRHLLLSLPRKTLTLIFVVHFLRLFIVGLLQLAQWKVAIPSIDMKVWFMFFALQVITSRIPFIPGRDLIFIGASLELSRVFQISAAGVAGMMIVSSFLDKSLNLLFYSIVSLTGKDRLSENTANEVKETTAVLSKSAPQTL